MKIVLLLVGVCDSFDYMIILTFLSTHMYSHGVPLDKIS